MPPAAIAHTVRAQRNPRGGTEARYMPGWFRVDVAFTENIPEALYLSTESRCKIKAVTPCGCTYAIPIPAAQARWKHYARFAGTGKCSDCTCMHVKGGVCTCKGPGAAVCQPLAGTGAPAAPAEPAVAAIQAAPAPALASAGKRSAAEAGLGERAASKRPAAAPPMAARPGGTAAAASSAPGAAGAAASSSAAPSAAAAEPSSGASPFTDVHPPASRKRPTPTPTAGPSAAAAEPPPAPTDTALVPFNPARARAGASHRGASHRGASLTNELCSLLDLGRQHLRSERAARGEDESPMTKLERLLAHEEMDLSRPNR